MLSASQNRDKGGERKMLFVEHSFCIFVMNIYPPRKKKVKIISYLFEK